MSMNDTMTDFKKGMGMMSTEASDTMKAFNTFMTEVLCDNVLDTKTKELIALGMAAFLAAVTQAPLTAFIIVMEMVDGGAMVLSLMAAAMVAAMLSRLISRPLYPALAGAMYLSLQPAYVVRDSREDNSHALHNAPEAAPPAPEAPSDIAPEAAPGSSAAPSSSPAEASADPSVPLPNTAAAQPPASTAPPEGSTSEDADTAGAADDSAPK